MQYSAWHPVFENVVRRESGLGERAEFIWTIIIETLLSDALWVKVPGRMKKMRGREQKRDRFRSAKRKIWEDMGLTQKL